MSKGFKGISFPFRIGVKGGVVMSDTTAFDISHITEGIEQLLRTRKGERGMEPQIGCDLSTHVFEPNDKSLHNLIAFEITEELNKDGKIEVISVDISSNDSFIYADITFKVLSFDTIYSHRVMIGGVNNA